MPVLRRAGAVIAVILTVFGLFFITGWLHQKPFGHHDINRVNSINCCGIPGFRINMAREPDLMKTDLIPLSIVLENAAKSKENLNILIVDLPGDPGIDYNMVENLQEDLFFNRRIRPIISNIFVGGLDNNASKQASPTVSKDSLLLVFHREPALPEKTLDKITKKLNFHNFRTKLVRIGVDYYTTVICRQ
jgi:hypothetical protein